MATKVVHSYDNPFPNANGTYEHVNETHNSNGVSIQQAIPELRSFVPEVKTTEILSFTETRRV